jgi:PAS domain S-box-containing protein
VIRCAEVEDRPDIVVVGGSAAERSALVAALAAAGLPARAEAALVLDDETALPGLIAVTGSDAAALVAEAREVPGLADVPVLAVVSAVPASAAAEALAAGASDVVRQPFGPAELAARVRNLVSGSIWSPGSYAPHLLRIHDELSSAEDDVEALVQVLTVACEALHFDRASLIAYLDGSEHAFVIAATDDPTRSHFMLLIADYPEVAEAIRTGEPVLLDDAQVHPLTQAVAPRLIERGIRGSAVFPVQWKRRTLGVILARKATPGVAHLAGRGVAMARMIGGIVAAHLRHGPVLESLRDQTHRISRVRYEAERRLRGIDSLKEHFEAGADGVVILDEAGRILFVNRAAEHITGFAGDGLLGTELADLAAPEQRVLLPDVVSKVLAGANVEPFDLSLSTTTGAPATVSVSTSTVLARTGAVIFTVRDVTAQRALETELRSTKEFLERLIDSTVDAIIAADMDGTIILFNQGAERLFGWRAEEVVGKHPVADMYPDGVARQIMRMLRSTSYGGVGRLEQTRREVKGRAGELIPVNMTASIIYEGVEEYATVGILSDLRDRIRMEQRLLQAQQKLEISEKQALVAELAGAAAHELNQPLTSIIGYSQLVQRQSPADAAHLRPVGVILAEAERMADIVKKIGRITKYETIDYVGSARMLDLDRSTSLPAVESPHDEAPTVSRNRAPTIDGIDGIDDEGRTREFTAIRPGQGLLSVLESELDDDPAVDHQHVPTDAQITAVHRALGADRRPAPAPAAPPGTTPRNGDDER